MCDTLVIVHEDGVWFAKNSDRDPGEAQILEWQPARDYAAGETLKATWIEIPQVAHTHAVLLSRPEWMWGVEIGANEHGVTIGNEAVFTGEPYAKTGLTGMDMNRIALERSTTAEEAVNILIELLERFGQGGGCGYEDRSFTYHNSFLVADSTEAFVVETAAKHYAVERVRYEGEPRVRTISNVLTIEAFAREHESLASRVVTKVACGKRRQSRTGILGRRAEHLHDLATVLRDHGEGNTVPRYRLLNGAMASVCMHAGGTVASSQTTASWIANLTAESTRHWVTATAAPCTSLFKPVTVDVPVELDFHALWWKHERFHRAAMRDPEAAFELFAGERDALEREWFARPPDSAEAFALAEARLDEWTRRVQTHASTDQRPAWTRAYWRRRPLPS